MRLSQSTGIDLIFGIDPHLGNRHHLIMTVNSHIVLPRICMKYQNILTEICMKIFWYFMHMRGNTICEFTVIIK